MELQNLYFRNFLEYMSLRRRSKDRQQLKLKLSLMFRNSLMLRILLSRIQYWCQLQLSHQNKGSQLIYLFNSLIIRDQETQTIGLPPSTVWKIMIQWLLFSNSHACRRYHLYPLNMTSHKDWAMSHLLVALLTLKLLLSNLKRFFFNPSSLLPIMKHRITITKTKKM